MRKIAQSVPEPMCVDVLEKFDKMLSSHIFRMNIRHPRYDYLLGIPGLHVLENGRQEILTALDVQRVCGHSAQQAESASRPPAEEHDDGMVIADGEAVPIASWSSAGASPRSIESDSSMLAASSWDQRVVDHEKRRAQQLLQQPFLRACAVPLPPRMDTERQRLLARIQTLEDKRNALGKKPREQLQRKNIGKKIGACRRCIKELAAKFGASCTRQKMNS